MNMFTDTLTDDPQRLMWAAAWAGLFAVICVWAMLTGRRKPVASAEYLVLYASQTGQAEEIAQRTAASLQAGGRDAVAVSTARVTAAQLVAAAHILCIVSTTGEGDAPDEALRFEKTLMQQTVDLSGQTVAVLALGDRKYEKFCAFGHRVFAWLMACGARVPAPVIEADDLDAAALKQWDERVASLGGRDAGAEDAGLPWQLEHRVRLNPQGDTGLYHLRFTGNDRQWQAGDLIEIITPGGHRRDYSIASLPHENCIDLYVREVMRSDGLPGDGSGLLVRDLQPGDRLPLRVKSHRNFHTPEGAGPLLLIGAGSGLAGLRPHILQANAQKRPVWLIYGERHPQRDGTLCEDMKLWRDDGRLDALDLAFSRPDTGEGRYVQAVVEARAADIPAWLGERGAVMCCGGLTMGLEVEHALAAVLGQAWVDEAKVSGRYRRDLY